VREFYKAVEEAQIRLSSEESTCGRRARPTLAVRGDPSRGSGGPGL